ILVAGTLPLLDKSAADPPDGWMKPEDGLHRGVHHAREVVAGQDRAELVGQEPFELGHIEAIAQSFGKEENLAKDAEDPGFEAGGGDPDRDGKLDGARTRVGTKTVEG